MVAHPVNRAGVATAEAEAWLAMAFRAAHQAALSKSELSDLCEHIIQASLPACLVGHSTADRLVLSEREAVFRYAAEHFGKKMGIGGIRQELRLRGQGKLAQQICGLNDTRRIPAHPGQMVEALKHALSLPLTPSPSSEGEEEPQLDKQLMEPEAEKTPGKVRANAETTIGENAQKCLFFNMDDEKVDRTLEDVEQTYAFQEGHDAVYSKNEANVARRYEYGVEKRVDENAVSWQEKTTGRENQFVQCWTKVFDQVYCVQSGPSALSWGPKPFLTLDVTNTKTDQGQIDAISKNPIAEQVGLVDNTPNDQMPYHEMDKAFGIWRRNAMLNYLSDAELSAGSDEDDEGVASSSDGDDASEDPIAEAFTNSLVDAYFDGTYNRERVKSLLSKFVRGRIASGDDRAAAVREGMCIIKTALALMKEDAF